MPKRTLTAILGTFVLLAGVGGYVYADIQDIAPGYLTSEPPIVGAEAPDREPVQASGALPARVLVDVPPIVPADVQPAWNKLVQAGKDQEFTPGAYVIDAMTGNVLLNGNGEQGMTPASVIKVLTALTTVNSINPTDTLATSVFIDEDGALHLVGEGDLLLAEGTGDPTEVNGHAGLEDLAKATANELADKYANRDVSTLVYHPKIFEGETRESALADGLEHWIGHLSAFAVDRGELPGVGYQPYRDDPGTHVAEVLQQNLKDLGVNVQIQKSDERFEEAGGTLVAAVNSATVGEVTRLMLADSDNTLAEQLCRMSSAAAGDGSTLPDATEHLEKVLGEAGVYNDNLVVHDCSGLNEKNKVAPRTIAEALRVIWTSEEPAVAQIMRDLPIGHFTGTLDSRFDGDANGVRVQAKTGSLDEVSSLAGYATTEKGRVLIFHVQSGGMKEGAFFTRHAVEEFAMDLTRL